jgi:peroxiredoxin
MVLIAASWPADYGQKEDDMKRAVSASAIILALFFVLVHPGLGGQATEDQIRKHLKSAQDLGDAGQYAKALESVRPLAEQAGRFTDKPELQYEVLDYEHFLLLKTGAFREALQTGFKIEELGRKISDRKSPWDCLKIADAYLGLKEYDEALDWVEKAVREREFTKLDTLQSEKFAPLREIPRFKALLSDVEKSLGIGQAARDFQVMLLDGTAFALSKQAGKIVLIDFWDVGCLPCRKAMPHLKDLHQKFGGQGLEIIGISLDTDRKLLEGFLKKYDLPWKIACTFKGWGDETAKLYRVNSTPSTWLIDRQGILRGVNLSGDTLTKAIVALL